MREHLLGYVLGALEPAEQELVEHHLETDPELRRLLSLLERRVEVLDCRDGNDDCPQNLASRTCDWIDSQAPRSTEPHPLESHTAEGRSGFVNQVSAGHSVAGRSDERRADSAHVVGLPPASLAPAPRGWSWADFLVAAGILLSAGMLFFPAIASSRQNSRLTACQNNLRSLGVALASYSDISGGAFPGVATSGQRAVAGIYGPILQYHDLIARPNMLVCPSSQLARRREEWRIATLREIDEATDVVLAKLHQEIGGSYGYSLGYLENGVLHAPRNLGQANYALMADAPCSTSATRQSPNHGGCGQNVLFGDQSVRYLVGCTLAQLGDDIFKNRQGFVEAGDGADDSVLGESSTPPLRRVTFDR